MLPKLKFIIFITIELFLVIAIAQQNIESSTNDNKFISSKSNSPFFFIIDDKTVEIGSTNIEYSTTDNELKAGQIKFKNSDFLIKLNNSIDQNQPNNEEIEVDTSNISIKFQFLEFLDKTGQRILLSKLQNNKLIISNARNQIKELFNSDYLFRMCLFSNYENNELRICSSLFTYDESSNNFKLLLRMEQFKNRVFLNNDEIKELNSILSPKGTDILAFNLENSVGMTLSYKGILPIFNFKEFTVDNENIIISGSGLIPAEIQLIDLSNDQTNHWGQTYSPQLFYERSTSWKGVISKVESSNLTFHNQVFSIFNTNLKFLNLPLEKDKLHLINKIPLASYTNSTTRQVYLSENTKFNNKNDIDQAKTNEITVIELTQKKHHDISLNELNIIDSNQYQRKLIYESILGTNSEVSIRLTCASGGNKATFLGELKTDYWFERIPFIDSEKLSLLRLGISAKYYQNVSDMSYIQKSDDSEIEIKTKMRLFFLDLKYRLQPGIWNRDETIGPIISYQQADITNTQFNLIGVGFFWARSMPYIFNEIMNYIPYMKYPKYVDLDFVYYPNSTSKDIRLISNWALNFHGKVMWTNQFFGEAGFGFKTYSILNNDNNNVALSSFYGTAGIGWQF